MGMTRPDSRCPKCGGTIMIDRDYHGWYEQCLQCSYMRDLKVIYQEKQGQKTTDESTRPSGRTAG
jgi:ribosomal protein S27AE